jgi:LysM repeat protein
VGVVPIDGRMAESPSRLSAGRWERAAGARISATVSEGALEMGFMDFVANAGAALFGGSGEPDQERSAKLENHVRILGLDVKQLKVDVKGETATVSGEAASQAEREKVLLAVGNTRGIAKVDDKLTVAAPKAAEAGPAAPEARYHTVVKGDSLSKIAKEYYGDAMKYPVIFEANKPMLEDPDKIYPGQVLRIPEA